MNRTLKRELKVPEIAEQEENGTSCSSKVRASHFSAKVGAGIDLDTILHVAINGNVSS